MRRTAAFRPVLAREEEAPAALISYQKAERSAPLASFDSYASLAAAFRAVRRATEKDGTVWLAQWNGILRSTYADEPLPAEVTLRADAP